MNEVLHNFDQMQEFCILYFLEGFLEFKGIFQDKSVYAKSGHY